MINQLQKQIILNTDISGFVLKTKYGTDKSGTEKEVSDVDKKSSDTNEFF